MYQNTIKSNKAVIYNNVSVSVFETGFEGGASQYCECLVEESGDSRHNGGEVSRWCRCGVQIERSQVMKGLTGEKQNLEIDMGWKCRV